MKRVSVYFSPQDNGPPLRRRSVPPGFPPNPPKLNVIGSSSSRPKLVLATKIVLAAAVIYFVAVAVRPEELLRAALRADLVLLAAAVLLLPVNIFTESAIWLPLLRLVLPGATWTSATRAVLGGYPLGFFTPGRVGEFAGRAFSISGQNRTAIGLSVAAARLPELAILLLVGLVTIVGMIATKTMLFSGISGFAAVTAVATAAAWFAVLLPAKVAHLLGRLTRSGSFRERLQFLNRVDARMGVSVVALSLLRLFVYCSQFVILTRAFSKEAGIAESFAAVIATFTAKAIVPPLTFLDLGIREGAAAFFFGEIGIGAAIGFNAALGLFAINVVLPTLIGLPLIGRYHLGKAPARLQAEAT